MNLAGYDQESIVNGDGMRTTLYISGCRHYCRGCFNSEAWRFDYGKPFTLDLQLSIIQDIMANPLLDGITLCGGDPFFSAHEVLAFVELLKQHKPDIHIWAYTGFTYEELILDPVKLALLKQCDVLVDGPFILAEKDLTLRFRGSRNQRILDVQRSLQEGTAQSY